MSEEYTPNDEDLQYFRSMLTDALNAGTRTKYLKTIFKQLEVYEEALYTYKKSKSSNVTKTVNVDGHITLHIQSYRPIDKIDLDIIIGKFKEAK